MREAPYEVAVGKDPAANRHDALYVETFADLAKEYMERHGRFKRCWREDQRMLYGSPHKKRTGKRPPVPIVRRCGAMKVREITRRHVRDLLLPAQSPKNQFSFPERHRAAAKEHLTHKVSDTPDCEP